MARPALTQTEIARFRARLCRVATRRFARRGYAGVSLRGLAAELGCSPTTPYRYFRDKDEIFAAVRARAFAKLADASEVVLGSEADPRRRLVRLGEAYLRFAHEAPHAYRVIFELAQPEPSRYPELEVERRRAWSAIRGAVRRALEARVVAGDLETVTHLFWAGLHGVAALHLAGQLQSRGLEALAEPMIETLLRGSAAAAGELPSPPTLSHGDTP
ncbi:MAG: TetR/AcrR family transcriptional regulator [Deltaproteobacteria bacterium]|nr:TetR/AcrR family transcriptional regulator [Deltaproteobacteria bacterium]